MFLYFSYPTSTSIINKTGGSCVKYNLPDLAADCFIFRKKMLNVLRVVAVIACLPVCTHALAGESNWLKCLASINQRYMTVFGETILQVEPSKDILLVDPAYHTNAGDIFIIGGEERLIKLFPKINVRQNRLIIFHSNWRNVLNATVSPAVMRRCAKYLWSS